MPGEWTKRMMRLGKAAQDARESALREMDDATARQVVEGLLTNPATPPRKKRRHPVSLSHRMRRRRRKHV